MVMYFSYALGFSSSFLHILPMIRRFCSQGRMIPASWENPKTYITFRSLTSSCLNKIYVLCCYTQRDACTNESYNSPIGHGAHYASYTRNLSELWQRIRVSARCSMNRCNENSIGNPLTFSCHPSSTLPLISPHPGMAMPLYRYFMSVS
jgi:hypothetical protein